MMETTGTLERLLDVKLIPGKLRQARARNVRSPPPPPTDLFFLTIEIRRLIHQYSSTTGGGDDYNYTEPIPIPTEESSESRTFDLQRTALVQSDNTTTTTTTTFISQILSRIGISTHHHSQVVSSIIPYAQSMITDPYYSHNIYDVPFLTVQIQIEKSPVVHDVPYAAATAAYASEEEEIRRATEESLMDIDIIRAMVPASRSSIEALEKAIFIQGFDYSSISEQQCMICLEKLINPSSSPLAVLKYEVEQVTRMPCFHLYHAHCIVRWLETSHLCPVCRFQLPTTT